MANGGRTGFEERELFILPTSAHVDEPLQSPYRAVRHGTAAMLFHLFPLEDLSSSITLTFGKQLGLGALYLGEHSPSVLLLAVPPPFRFVVVKFFLPSQWFRTCGRRSVLVVPTDA